MGRSFSFIKSSRRTANAGNYTTSTRFLLATVMAGFISARTMLPDYINVYVYIVVFVYCYQSVERTIS